jgi:hypothetical protein
MLRIWCNVCSSKVGIEVLARMCSLDCHKNDASLCREDTLESFRGADLDLDTVRKEVGSWLALGTQDGSEEIWP